jgi:hypothetical protein
MRWITKNGGRYDTLKQVGQDRAPFLSFGGGYVAFCNRCGHELEHVVCIGVTGVGVHQDTVFACASCNLTGTKTESWVETELYFAPVPDLT